MKINTLRIKQHMCANLMTQLLHVFLLRSAALTLKGDEHI